MRRSKGFYSGIFLLLMILSRSSALEAGFSSYFGTYGLAEYAEEDTEYDDFFQWGGNIFYKDSSGVSDTLFYTLSLDADPLLKYRFKSELEFITPYYTISFGPAFGIVHQSWTLIKPGFSGRMRAQWPGRAYFDLGGELIPLRSSLLEEDYSTYSGYYTLGFYVRRDHILCYFTQKRDHYSSISDGKTTSENRTSYLFYADFFEKNSILKVQSKLGYEIQDQILSQDNTIEIKSILLGLQLDFSINGNSTVFLGLDNRLYPLTTGSQELSSVPGYLYTFTTGFKWYQ